MVVACSQPEPDLSVLHPRADFYAAAHPTSADVVLLVEVADSSAASDRRQKLPLYARGGVAEVWLLDLVAGVLERHRGPGPDGFTTVTRHTGGTLAPAGAPDLVVDVATLLPGRDGRGG